MFFLGRTGPGVCYRLYENSEFDGFQRYTTPEILRVPLDGLILQMISMGLPNARKYKKNTFSCQINYHSALIPKTTEFF